MGWEIPKLGKAVAHWQHGFGVVEMDGRPELHRWKLCRKDIRETEPGMIVHDMASAASAVSPSARAHLVEHPEDVRALRDLTFSSFHKVKAVKGAPE